MVYHKYFMIAMIKVLLMIRMKSCDDKNDDDADMTMLKLKIDQDFEIMCLMMVMMTVMMVMIITSYQLSVVHMNQNDSPSLTWISCENIFE